MKIPYNQPSVPRKVAVVSVIVKVESADKCAALSISTELIADDDPSLNTAEPLVGTYSRPLTACNKHTVNRRLYSTLSSVWKKRRMDCTKDDLTEPIKVKG